MALADLPANRPPNGSAPDLDSLRSPTSKAFQLAWANIPKTGFIPDKADFRAERFAPFFPIIYLIELSDDPEKRMMFRLAGQTVRDNIGLDLKGWNYANFIPEEHRTRSGISMFRMFADPPCGRWVCKKVIHRGGHHQPVQLTQMPMMSDSEGKRLVLGIVEGLEREPPHSPDGYFRMENVHGDHPVDIGAGLPG